jgi:hypothetical protein
MTHINLQVWSELVAGLQSANHTYATNGREGVIETLQAFISFCESVPDLQAGLTPLVAGLAAVDGLKVGTISPLVKPVSFGNRPPEMAYRSTIKGVALACANALSKAGMSRGAADERVGRYLEKVGFDLVGRTSTCAKVLKGWRETLSRQKGRTCQFVDSFHAFEELLRTKNYTFAEEAWLDLTPRLGNLVTSMRPALN